MGKRRRRQAPLVRLGLWRERPASREKTHKRTRARAHFTLRSLSSSASLLLLYNNKTEERRGEELLLPTTVHPFLLLKRRRAKEARRHDSGHSSARGKSSGWSCHELRGVAKKEGKRSEGHGHQPFLWLAQATASSSAKATRRTEGERSRSRPGGGKLGEYSEHHSRGKSSGWSCHELRGVAKKEGKRS